MARGRSVALALGLLVAIVVPATATTRMAPSDAWAASATAPDERLAELALSLGFEVERIFRFVADEIRYEPYAGILRGAVGTLDAGAGNSLDQALLLAALLDESGITYRFARGALDGAAAAQLLDASSMDITEARAAAELAENGGPYPARIEIGEPGPADPQVVSAIEEATSAALEVADVQVSRSVQLITTALADAGIGLGDASAPRPVSLLPASEVTGHTWLQVAQGPDHLDLDPTPGAAAIIGSTLAEVDETLAALPDEERHVVRFEVLVERVRGDGLETVPLIEHEGFADELAGERVTLAHIEPSAVHGLGVAIDSLDGEATVAYHPILTIPGGALVATQGVTLGVTRGGGGVFDAASPDPGTLADGEATAEWLEVTIESPGADPVAARRPIFDRIAADARYGGQPSLADVRPVELLPWEADGSLDFVPLLGTDAFVISTGPASAPAMLAQAVAPDADMTTILATSYLALRDVVAGRDTLDDGIITFVDRPGVVSYAIDVGLDDAGEPTLTHGLDLWHRSLAAVAARGGTASRAGSNLRAGVVEHIAERLAVGIRPDDGGPAAPAVGVSSVFEAAEEAGIPTLVLQDRIPEGMSLRPRTRTLIEDALRTGETVIVPARPVSIDGRDRLGWWRVDPATGLTVDTMDDGMAAAMVEISRIHRMIACAAVFAPAYTQLLGIIFERAARPLNFAAGATTAYWIWNAANVPKVVVACTQGVVPA